MNSMEFDKELDRIIEVSKEYGAHKVILFGSSLGDVNSAGDIDIAVSGIQPQVYFEYCGKISMEVKKEVDIIDLDDIREHFYQRIISQGRVLYDRAA